MTTQEDGVSLDDRPLSEDDKKALFRDLSEKQKEISELRQKLNSINDQKEAAFTKREGITKEITQSISQIKDVKAKRDALSSDVKNTKKKRDEINKKISAEQKKLNTFNKEKEEIISKHKIKEDPSQIQRDIKRLEYKLETEVMSFEKEKGFMKNIKQLKKKVKDATVLKGVLQKINTVRGNIRDLRKDAQGLHQKVMSKATSSQERHKSLIGTSKEIDTIRDKEDVALGEFLKKKKEFKEVNEQLKKKLDELNKLNKKAGIIKKEKAKAKQKKEDDILKSKEEVVQEKMKKGEKLTTEDLLVMQKVMKD